jgi:hypothetical protein
VTNHIRDYLTAHAGRIGDPGMLIPLKPPGHSEMMAPGIPT